MEFRRILIAVDRSPIAAHAASVGADLARALRAEVAFVHVIDLAQQVVPVDSGVPADQLLALAREDARRLLAEFQPQDPGASPAHEFLMEGKPATDIVRAAREWPADVLVIGSHGRRGVPRLVLGSVAEGVMRHALCPVLVVRGDS